MTRLDRRLNLVVPVEQEKGTLQVFSMPIGKEVFERYFRVFSKTFANMYAEGGAITGPRLAAMYLKVTAADMGMEEEVEANLMSEIRRLTNVLMPTDTGWEQKTWDDVVRNKLIDEDDISEVEGAITFFTLVSHMHKKAEVPAILAGSARLWGAQSTSLTLMEFRNSLATSTKDAPSSEKARPLSIPS